MQRSVFAGFVTFVVNIRLALHMWHGRPAHADLEARAGRPCHGERRRGAIDQPAISSVYSVSL